MKKSLAIIFCFVLTACSFLDKHPELEKDLKAVEVQVIDSAAQDAKEIIHRPSGASGL